MMLEQENHQLGAAASGEKLAKPSSSSSSPPPPSPPQQQANKSTTNSTVTTTTTTTTTTSAIITSKQAQQQTPTNINSTLTNPLYDHDYCSPNKASINNSNSGTLMKTTKVPPTTLSAKKASPSTANMHQQHHYQLQPQQQSLDTSGREKRQRKQTHDPEFSHFTSSEYSSSEAESEDDSDHDGNNSEYYSEDDPARPWCVCNQPHNDEFMISCDICKYWYHGRCVGVTASMNKKYAFGSKEWFCAECRMQLQSGTDRNAIPEKLVKKEKKKKISKKTSGKRGRGRPKKSESSDLTTRMSTRNARKSTSSIDSKFGKRKSDLRSESFEDFDNNDRLKALIKERKKQFFIKRRLAEEQQQAKMKELGLGRTSLTTPSLGNSLNSLASNTSSPNMADLPTNMRSEHKDRSKRNIVLQINTKKDGSGSDQDGQRLVTTIVKSKKRKQSESNDQNVVSDLFTAEPLQINKKSRPKTDSSSSASVQNPAGDTSSPSRDRKSTSPSVKLEKHASTSGSHSESASTPKKKRKDSESSTANGSSTPTGSKQIAQKIKECLEIRSKQIKDLEVQPSERTIEKLAADIENQLNECFREGSQKYLNKYRSLVFNLRDQKNQMLIKNVLSGEILPSRLVRMTPEELASSELAKWRERENKHSIELIKRDAQLAAQQVIVKKTHKGEEVISAPAANEPDDPTAVVNNQEPPTTPTKPTPKTDVHKPSQSPTSTEVAAKSTGALKMKISGIQQQASSSHKSVKDQEQPDSTTSIIESLTCMDTTKDHKNHVFDMNCRICTKLEKEVEEVAAPSATKEPKQEPAKSSEGESSTPKTEEPNQPKRLRVSIETTMDPAALSRLREPLIKPQEPAPDAGEYSPSKVTPADEQSEHEADDDDELYDPEMLVLNKSNSSTPSSAPTLSNEPCWSGQISSSDVGKFRAYAKAVSGNVDFMRDEMKEQNLVVLGRLAPDSVYSYFKKLKSTTKNSILMIQFHPLAEEDKTNFNLLFDYFYGRNRCGVISIPSNQPLLKDFYIIPIHEKSNIPEALKPINGPGLDRKEQPNCLLGVLVKTKRSPSASSSASGR